MSIKTKNASLIYKDNDNLISAVVDLTLELPQTGLIGILGASGSGKTSLLYLLSGIRQPTSGNVDFSNLDKANYDSLSQLRRNKMGFVFQNHFLINYLTVVENILVGLPKNRKISKEQIHNLLTSLGLQNIENRLPKQISGGQKQRVAIARSLVHNPNILFIDEPTSSLDKKRGREVIQIFEEIAQHKCVVLVTHDPQNLINADKIYEMLDGKLKLYPKS